MLLLGPGTACPVEHIGRALLPEWPIEAESGADDDRIAADADRDAEVVVFSPVRCDQPLLPAPNAAGSREHICRTCGVFFTRSTGDEGIATEAERNTEASNGTHIHPLL